MLTETLVVSPTAVPQGTKYEASRPRERKLGTWDGSLVPPRSCCGEAKATVEAQGPARHRAVRSELRSGASRSEGQTCAGWLRPRPQSRRLSSPPPRLDPSRHARGTRWEPSD